jgi:4-amino-4-deoxy-L-arabinose transferase-like glycosyltransferase
MKSLEHPRSIGFALPLFFSTLGGAVIFYGTHWGPWVFSDSVEYIEVARNLLAGYGLVLMRPDGGFVPLTFRPPLYSMVLAAAGSFGSDIMVAARWLDIVLFAILIFTMGYFIYAWSRNLALTLASLIFTLISPTLLRNYTGAMSEGLFFTLGTLGLFLLIYYFHGRGKLWLLIAGFLLGLTWLDRYSGIVYIATGALAILIWGRNEWKQRFSEILVFIIPALLPFLTWSASVYSAGGSPGTYEFSLQNLWVMFEPVRRGLAEVFWVWLPFQFSLAYQYKLVAILFLASLFFGLVFFVFRQGQKTGLADFWHDPIYQTASLFLLFSIIYTAFLIATFIVVEFPKPAFNERVLSPLQLSIFLSFLLYVQLAVKDLQRWNWAVYVLPLVIIGGLATRYLPRSMELIQNLHQSGAGYTSKVWQDSRLLDTLKQLPDDLPLISNDHAAIVFFLGRPAYEITEFTNGIPREETPPFGYNTSDGTELIFREKGAALVLFNSAYKIFSEADAAKARKRWDKLTGGLYEYHKSRDGVVYFFDERSAP